MCLILHGHGHLTIKVLLEQLWPMYDRKRKALTFLQCYDVILRSHSKTSLNKLYVLCSQPTPAGSPLRLERPESRMLSLTDWIVTEEIGSATDTLRTIRVDASAVFQVKRLIPRLAPQSWMSQDFDAVAVFRYAKMSLARVTFEGNGVIERFDPAHPGETTYWIRFAFVPEKNSASERPTFAFGALGSPLFQIRSCQILSPPLVLGELSDRLDLFEADEVLADGARAARKHIFDELFHKPSTSTRVEDHRIALVASPEFLVLNSVLQGKCGFHGVQPVKTTNPPAVARMWFAGARHYPTTDPICMARLVYGYLREWAWNEKDAKQKEAISSAVAPESHTNVSHVVDALCKLGYIREARDAKGRYWVDEVLPDGSLFLANPAGTSEIDLGERDTEIRDSLYGELSLPDRPQSSRFSFLLGGPRIHYDLAYGAGMT
jgi:hypothetical protein